MSHKNVKWEKIMHPGYAPRKHFYAPETTAGVDSDRPEALEKCIDSSLSSPSQLHEIHVGTNDHVQLLTA